VPVPVASQAQADALFGQGSMLACMFRAFFANNWANEVWGLPYAEPTGVAAVNTITVTNPPTAAGTIDLYVAGQNVQVYVAATDTVSNVATSIAAAINKLKDLPVTAVATVGAVACTTKFKGTAGNEIRISDSYYGTVGGEMLPPGLTLTYTATTPGTGDPSHSDNMAAIAALGESEVDWVALPFTDATSLTDWETEFGFSDTGRWGFIRQHYGHLFSAKRDTLANLLTFGLTRNSGQLSVLGIEVASPTPTYEWAAAYTAKAARALLNDPARPLQTLTLDSCLPARGLNRFLLSELNQLAYGGIATQRTHTTVPTIMRESTTYTRNLYGNTDDAYELVTTLATLTKLLRNQRQAITSKYPRHKLADDGTRFGAGQAIVTPKVIKAELVAQYRIDEFVGLVENGKAFKENLIVERDPNDPNRLNVLYPPDLVNQLRIFAVLAQFRLQYNRGLDTVIAA
jgi:phage tail sheath gpL-like